MVSVVYHLKQAGLDIDVNFDLIEQFVDQYKLNEKVSFEFSNQETNKLQILSTTIYLKITISIVTVDFDQLRNIEKTILQSQKNRTTFSYKNRSRNDVLVLLENDTDYLEKVKFKRHL